MKPMDKIEVNLKNYSLFDDVELELSSLEIVQEEIGETAESRERCLQLLRKSLTERKDLHPCLDEKFLLGFLRVSKFRHKKALDRILRYYGSQEKYLKMFKHHSMSIKEAQTFRYLSASPYRMKNNSVIIISKLATIDYSTLAFEAKLYLDTIVASKLLTNPVSQMGGLNLIIDGTGFSLHTMMVHTLGRIRNLIEMLVMILPARARSVHIVNAPKVTPTMYRMIHPFMPQKIQKRIFIHPNNDNWESLHSYFPKEIMPEDYGGDVKLSNMIDLLENVDDAEMSFREQLKYGFKNTEKLRSTWSGIALT